MVEERQLYTKYRPQSFEDLFGNITTIKSAKQVLKKATGKPQTYMISGPSGCGKTTIARIMAKELGCSGRDLTELDVATTRDMATIRNIIDHTKYAPIDSKSKVYILDEAQQYKTDSQNALLKTLEYPPPNVYFFILTTDPDKLIETVKNRCVHWRVNTLDKKAMTALLDKVCAAEDIDLPSNLHYELLISAEHCPRKLLVNLEKISGMIGKETIEDIVEVIKGVSEELQRDIGELYNSIWRGEKWEVAARQVQKWKKKETDVLRTMLSYMGGVLLRSGDYRDALIIRETMDAFRIITQPYNSDRFATFVYAWYKVWEICNKERR